MYHFYTTRILKGNRPNILKQRKKRKKIPLADIEQFRVLTSRSLAMPTRGGPSFQGGALLARLLLGGWNPRRSL